MPSLSDYVYEMLRSEELNEWDAIIVDTLATGDDAARTITASALIDENSNADETAYGGWYAFDLTTFEQQRVRVSGNFVPSTGALTTNGEFSSALPVGRGLLLIRRLGMVRQHGRGGLRDAVNEALRDLAFRYELTLDSDRWQSDGTYDVSDIDWLTEDRIIELRQSITSGAPPWLVPGTPTLRRNGASKYLIPQKKAASTSEYIAVLARPCHTYIKSKRTARATATATAGAITAITVDDAGEGYTSAPTVTISGAGTGATATATLSDDGVASFTITAGGTGYATATTTVTISAPTGTWADSTVGLVNQDDEAIPSVEDVKPCALYHAYLSLMRGPAEDSAYWKIAADRISLDALEKKWKAMPRRERNDDLLEDEIGAIDESYYSWPS